MKQSLSFPNQNSKFKIQNFTLLLFALWPLAFSLQPLFAATITGSLTDISLQPLNTKIMFSPTTNILLTPSGLSAGPPRIIDTFSGAFSLPLEAGDYTVSLPLITWRAPLKISVPDSGATINITNLLAAPTTYTYTNYLATAPLKVNATRVTVLSTASPATLLDSAVTLPAGVLAARNIITFDAFGSITDPGINGPNVTLTLKLGSTTVCTATKSCSAGSWHLSALVTIRSAGTSGSVAASMAFIQDVGNIFPFDTTITTLNTTGSLGVVLTAAIDNFTGAESVICDQLLITLH